MYAAMALDVHYEGKSLLRVPLARGQTEIPLAGDDRKMGAAGRISSVGEGWTGDSIRQRQTGPHGTHCRRADPWLAIQTASPHFNGSVENLRITGSPVIPGEIDVTAAPDLSPGEPITTATPATAPEALWTRQKDEIVGNLHQNAPGSRRESVLHYHRPLLEDGELNTSSSTSPARRRSIPRWIAPRC